MSVWGAVFLLSKWGEALKVLEKKISEITPYDKNPRNNDDAVDFLAQSIKEFGFRVPINVDVNNVIITGHTRYKAAIQLGLKTVPVVVCSDLTEEQVKAYRLADNKVGELALWDEALLNAELAEIKDLNMEDFGFELFDEQEQELKDYRDNLNPKGLVERFLAPPFSIIDSRQGYWMERKRAWKALGLESGVGRADNLLGFSNLANATAMSTGTSIFDPALCETMYKWFGIEGGKIFDPFAGGSVRGVVAAKLGFDYLGIDLRKEQVDANIANAKELGVSPKWVCDDSLNTDKYVEDESVDLVFSCPPYADLEKYSDDPRDLSNMDYDKFVKIYTEIIAKACKKLKKDRFAVFVVGDVRDKKGFYRDFLGDTKNAFKKAGCALYNDMVFIESIGSAALRASQIFNSYRKVVKTHQNILVFYKGDPKKIKGNYVEVDAEEIIRENIDDALED